MRPFDVWAPGKSRVDVVVDGRRAAMERVDGGWWVSRDVEARAGARYGFSLDGGPVRPDPRSPSQPDGVFGLSEVVDAGGHGWADAGWRGLGLPGLVFYELHVGTFSAAGTFDGAIEHIPQLVELGVGAVELMPVAEFAGDRGWGYDGVDLFAPHHAYGGPAGLRRFVDACHQAGLAVVLDVVYNHLGPAGNFLSEFGPYFTDRHRTPWGPAVNFDGPDSLEVRRFVVDNAAMWIRDYHVDGLRLDAVLAIVDRSAINILEEINNAVIATGHELGRTAFVVAESALNEPRFVRPVEAGGYGLAAAWDDDWHHALHAVLTGERQGYYEDFGSIDQLAKALRQAWVYDGVRSKHRGAVRGRSPRGLEPHRFVIALQNHDQVGNRAAGERLAALLPPRKLKVAAALLLTSPFTPLLFQGEEWAATTPFQFFTDHEAGLGRAVSSGRRAEFAAFGWKPGDVPDPQDPATFERSKLAWQEIDRPPHAEMRDWYRRLIALRKTIRDGGEVIVECPKPGEVLVRRPGVTVAVNLGDAGWTPPPPLPGWRVAMASEDVVISVPDVVG
ncbi:MAG TPA: malto-oligosyltrehalose trehalohydrolase [Candidatus Dormibacteraeota bacterium]|nr:malto-oligosyltrehalose trehalohydrolase [Candidatus Dormibacteraeota bacterium]